MSIPVVPHLRSKRLAPDPTASKRARGFPSQPPHSRGVDNHREVRQHSCATAQLFEAHPLDCVQGGPVGQEVLHRRLKCICAGLVQIRHATRFIWFTPYPRMSTPSSADAYTSLLSECFSGQLASPLVHWKTQPDGMQGQLVQSPEAASVEACEEALDSFVAAGLILRHHYFGSTSDGHLLFVVARRPDPERSAEGEDEG